MKYTIEFQKTYGEKTIIVVEFGNDARCIEKHPSLYHPNTTDYYCEHKSIRSVPNDVSFDAVVKACFVVALFLKNLMVILLNGVRQIECCSWWKKIPSAATLLSLAHLQQNKHCSYSTKQGSLFFSFLWDSYKTF